MLDLVGRRVMFKLLFVLALPACVGATANEIPLVVVLAVQDAKPFIQTHASFEASLTQNDEIQVIVASTQSELQALSQRRPDLVFALGSAAVKQSQAIFDEAPLLATMIVSESTLADVPHATAVLLRTSPKAQLEWHKQLLPHARRVGVLYDPAHSSDWVQEAKAVAQTLGLEIVAIPVATAKELPPALKAIGRRADSILGIADSTVYSSKTAKAILLFSFRNRIPFIGVSGAWVKAGALSGLEADYPKLGHQCAALALEILGGADPGAIQPQQAQGLVYRLNLKTAAQLKMDLNAELIAGAAQVFE